MYSSKVQHLITRLDTPLKVQAWLKTLDYHMGDSMRTLPEVVRTKSVHCLEAAMAAAAVLEHHGYPPLLLDIDSTDKLGHDLFLYTHNGRYGTVGASRDIGLYGRKPVFTTIKSLVASYAAPYIDAEAEITGYAVLDLRTLSDGRWRDSKRQVWYVERALINAPHHPFRSSRTFVKTWRDRYVQFRQKYPDKQPDYFPEIKGWL